MKVELEPRNVLDPMPTVLVGALVDGKPNYLAIAWVGIVGRNMISVTLNKRHYTNQGIKENKSFSVNVPSARMVEETDYCGLVSGRDVDKGALFKTFYGKLQTAPMIEECPLNAECRLINHIESPTHDLFIGEVVTTYCDDNVLQENSVDVARVDPIFLNMSHRTYLRVSERVANAFEVGKKLNPSAR